MGLTASVEESPDVPTQEVDEESFAALVIQKSWKKRGPTEFKWPDNLYNELKDMHNLASLGTYLDLLFKSLRPEDIEELGLKPPAKIATPPGTTEEEQPPAPPAPPKVTLARLQSFIKEKKDILKASEKMATSVDGLLALLQAISESMSSRTLSLVGFDLAKVQNKTLYYFIFRDDKLKRLTLIFPASSASYDPEWGTKMNQTKEMATLKRALKARVSGDRIAKVGVHQGFYNFLLTKQTSNQTASKYAELVTQLSTIFKTHPKHRMYITGHGVAGSIAQLLAFFLTFEDTVDIPKPISCVNFGSPRVGDASFWRACQLLEIAAKMRSCRVVMGNKGDSMPCYPSQGGYTHAGYQVALGGNTPPVTPSYPTVSHDGMPRFNMFTGKAEKTATKSSQEYMDALVANEDALKAMDLNKLYVAVGAKSLMYLEPSASSM